MRKWPGNTFSREKLELPIASIHKKPDNNKISILCFQNISRHLVCYIEKAGSLFAHCSINITESIHQLWQWLYWCGLGRMLRTILSVKRWKTKALSRERLHIPRMLANFLQHSTMKGHVDSACYCALSVKKNKKRSKNITISSGSET